MIRLRSFVALAALILAATAVAQSPESAVIEAALNRAALSVVQLRSAAGDDATSRTTSAVVLSTDGFLITSDFVISDRDVPLVVATADGRQAAARVVAVDEVRQLVLLRIEGAGGLAPPLAAEPDMMRVGVWALAVGRALRAESPNVNVGILSATERLGRIALQSDAKTSPANYGGLLVDIEGRALGLIVPLAPVGEGRAAAIEYYDSGIGFAIPWSDVLASAEKLRPGNDLKRGRLGLSLSSEKTPDEPAVITSVRADSPAQAAGLKAGDTLVALDGRAVPRGREMQARLRRTYAGQPLRVSILRSGNPLDVSVTPIETLPPRAIAFLGILPGKSSSDGLSVRWVFPGSAADGSELRAGDVIKQAAGKPIASPDVLAAILGERQPGDELKLDVTRGRETSERPVTLGPIDEGIPADVPPREMAAPVVGNALRVGRIELPIAGRAEACLAFVPDQADAERGYGLVVWFHGPAATGVDATLTAWQPLCEKHGLALLLPQAADLRRWTLDDQEATQTAIAELAKRVKIDRSRVVAAGISTGGAQAFRLALGSTTPFRGVAAIDAPLSVEPAEFDPLRPTLVYQAVSPGSRQAKRITTGISLLRERGYPVILRDLGPQPRGLSTDELDELALWIDALDRM